MVSCKIFICVLQVTGVAAIYKVENYLETGKYFILVTDVELFYSCQANPSLASFRRPSFIARASVGATTRY